MSAPARLLGLRVQGFKSFAERTLVEFGPGISAVVGPNGSGKSNLADALRWALGEQGRSLRIRKSEDVIWAGSERRAAQGMADVTIVLDNGDALLPVEYSVVELGRRLYRSGENDYLLNRQRVRLRDLVDLLDSANLAENAFLFIGQGMVDQALALRPEERRPLFEEVAGVRRHERRRRRAEDQLAEAETNLARVDDILAELRPQARRLGQLAEQQATRLTAGEELAAALIVAAHGRWHEAALRAASAEQRSRRAARRGRAGAGGPRAGRDRGRRDRRRRWRLARSSRASVAPPTRRRARNGPPWACARRGRRASRRPRPATGRGSPASVRRRRRTSRRIAGHSPSRCPSRTSRPRRSWPRRTGPSRRGCRSWEPCGRRAGRVATSWRPCSVRRRRGRPRPRRPGGASTTRRDGPRTKAAERPRARRAGRRSRRASRRSARRWPPPRPRKRPRSRRARRPGSRSRPRTGHAGPRRSGRHGPGRRSPASAARSTRWSGGSPTRRRGASRRPRGGPAAGASTTTSASSPGCGPAVEAALGELARAYVVDGAAVAGMGGERGQLAVRERIEAFDKVAGGGSPSELRRLDDTVASVHGGRLRDAIRRDPGGAARALLERAVWAPDLEAALRIQPSLPVGWIVATRDGGAVLDAVSVRIGRGDSPLEARAEAERLGREAEARSGGGGGGRASRRPRGARGRRGPGVARGLAHGGVRGGRGQAPSGGAGTRRRAGARGGRARGRLAPRAGRPAERRGGAGRRRAGGAR